MSIGAYSALLCILKALILKHLIKMGNYFLLDEPIVNDKNKETKKSETPAQDKFTERSSVLNESIASLFTIEKKFNLTSESKAHLKSLMVERSD